MIGFFQIMVTVIGLILKLGSLISERTLIVLIVLGLSYTSVGFIETIIMKVKGK